MLRKQLDCAPVGDGVRLRKIFHGFYQQTLTIHVTGVSRALTLSTTEIRCDRDRKNFCHEKTHQRETLASIASSATFFSRNLYLLRYEVHTRILPLRRHELRLARRLQLEDGVGDFLIDLNIRIFGQTVVARRFEKLLL